MFANSEANGGEYLNGEGERIVDTDIIVDMLRGVRANRDYIRRFELGELKGILSAVVIAELYAGRRTRDPIVARRIENVIALFTVVPVSPNIARKAGELIRDYGLNLPDAMIAATALAYNAVLVIRNIRDFQHIPNLRLEVPYT